MRSKQFSTRNIFASNRPALHQPVDLPLVTNGPDNAINNANANAQQRGRNRGIGPI